MKQLVDIARTYIGTPFHHQGRLPGVGLDCIGVVVCAMREAGLDVSDDVAGYGRLPSGGVFMAAVERRCRSVPIEEALPGDVMMFAFRTEPQHIAIYTGDNTLIHAYQEVEAVVENSLDDTWRARLRGVFRLREAG